MKAKLLFGMLVVPLLLWCGSVALGQTTNDFRSINSGDWFNTANWQRFDGATWVAATYFPGSNGGSVETVTVQTGHAIDLAVNLTNATNKMANLVVDAGGSVDVSDGNIYVMHVRGDLTVNGAIGRTAGDLFIDFTNGGTSTISGTGTLSPSGLGHRVLAANDSKTLVFDRASTTLPLLYTRTAVAGIATTNVTLNAGRTLTLTADAGVTLLSSNAPADGVTNQVGGVWTVNGTLTVQGTLYAYSLSNTAASKSAIQVASGGTLRVHTLDASASNAASADQHTLTVADGALLEITSAFASSNGTGNTVTLGATSVVSYNSAGGQLILPFRSGASDVAYGRLHLTGGGAKTLDASITSASTVVGSGNVNLNGNQFNIPASGVLQLGAGSLSAAPTFAASGSIQYLTSRTVGVEWPAALTLDTLRLLGAGQTLTLDANRSVAYGLELTTGNTIDLGGFDLALLASGRLMGADSLGWAYGGTFTRGFNAEVTAGNKLLPIGTSTVARHAEVGFVTGGQPSTAFSLTGSYQEYPTGVIPGMANTTFPLAATTALGTDDNQIDGTDNVAGRMWTLTPTVAQAAPYTLVLHHNGDINGANPGSVVLMKRNNASSAFSAYGDGASNTGTTLVATGVVGFSEMVYATTEAVVLPVRLISFTAARETASVRLNWVTASEENNDRFEVERAIGTPDQFVKIGEVDGNGTTQNISTYTWLDGSAPQGGRVYYRLKQVDFDGAFEYSPIVELEGTQGGRWRLAPNPTTGPVQLVSVSGEFDFNERINVLVMGQDGRVLLSQRGTVAQTSIALGDLFAKAQAGLYVVRIQSTQGEETLRVVRQ